MGAKLSGSFKERADPKVQLEQAITEAQEQHRRLTEQAANVIAQPEADRDAAQPRAWTTSRRSTRNARQALMLSRRADEARATPRRRPSTSRRRSRSRTGSSRSRREVEALKTHAARVDADADQAKAAVQQNSSALQKKLAERQKLLSQLDQAKMQEQMNKAMASLSETVGQDVPTLRRGPRQDRGPLRQGQGHGRAHRLAVESRMLEIEQAQIERRGAGPPLASCAPSSACRLRPRKPRPRRPATEARARAAAADHEQPSPGS